MPENPIDSIEKCANCLQTDKHLFFCRNCWLIKYCCESCLIDDLEKHQRFCNIRSEQLSLIAPTDKASRKMSNLLKTSLLQNSILENRIKQLEQKNEESQVPYLKQRIKELEEKLKYSNRSHKTFSCSKNSIKIIKTMKSRSGLLDIYIGSKVSGLKTFIDVYVKIGRKLNCKDNCEVSRQVLKKRVLKLIDVISILAGYDKNLDINKKSSDIKCLLEILFDKIPDLKSCDCRKQMSPSETAQFHSMVTKTWGNRRRAVEF